MPRLQVTLTGGDKREFDVCHACVVEFKPEQGDDAFNLCHEPEIQDDNHSHFSDIDVAHEPYENGEVLCNWCDTRLTEVDNKYPTEEEMYGETEE